jgi:hypothetical protein
MRDVTQGRLLIMVSVVTAIAYFWALFLSPEDPAFLGRTIHEWALIIPIMIIVFIFLFILAWIGWAMSTTPPDLDSETEDSTISTQST